MKLYTLFRQRALRTIPYIWAERPYIYRECARVPPPLPSLGNFTEYYASIHALNCQLNVGQGDGCSEKKQ